MTRGLIVTLSAEEIARSRLIAEGRNRKEAAGVRSKKWCGRYTEFDAHFLGACGEMAGAKALGVDVDDRIFLHGDDGVDMVAFGFSWQIKARTFRGAFVDLVFKSADEFSADAAMLVHSASHESHRIAGIISRARFLQIAKPKDYGYGLHLAVDERELKPIDLILKKKTELQTVDDWLADYSGAGG